MGVIEPPAALGLGTASSRHTGASIPAPTVVGRAPELGVLFERLASARRGEGGILFVTGEAGIGKSRLCRELAARAGGTVEYLHGAGSPLLPEAPFGPFVDALRAWLRDLSPEAVRGLLGSSLPEMGRLLPELAEVTAPPPSSGDGRRWLLESCLRLIQRLAERRPLLLVLEDLQWVDRGTVELVRYLAGPVQNRAVLLVCTHRTDEAPPGSPLAALTHDLLRERLGARLDLHPLDQRATGELIRAFFQLDRPVSSEFAAAVRGCASGNPFFIEEAIKSLIERGDVFAEDGQVQRRDLRDLVLPPAARELVTARLNHLTSESRRVIEPLTVAGRPCAIAVLAHAAGLSPAEAATAAGEAYRRGFLIPAPGGYRFRHDLVRRALLEQLLPEEQGALHLRLAQAIEHVHAEVLESWAEELASHYWAAGHPAHAAVPAWTAALRAVSLHAYREALPYLHMCHAAGPAGPHREAVLDLLGDAHARTGAPGEAAAAYRSLLAEAEAGDRPRCAGRALRKLAELAHDQGDPHRALALCRRAVDVLRDAGDQQELAAAYTGVARYESATGDWRAAVGTAERAVTAAEASGDVQAFCPAANWLAFHLAYTGQIDRAERAALASVERAAAADDLPALQQTYQTLGTIRGDLRADYAGARHAYLSSLRIARRCGDLPAEVKALHNLGAWVSKPLGQWRRADLLLARARARAVDAGLHRHAVYALLHLAELAWLRGDLCLLEEQLQTLEAEVIQYGDLMTRCRLAAKVHAPWLLHRGCPAAARDELRARWQEAERAGFVGGVVVLGPPLAETLLDLGDCTGATAVLDRLQALWPGVGDRAEIIEGRRVLARLTAAQGHATRALDLLVQAEVEARALRRPFDVARLHREQAVLLAAGSDPAARDLFRQALLAFDRLGAAGEAESTRRLARQHGLDLRLRRNGGAAPLPGGLSARELEVAGLVANGETNRAIAATLSLSEATIESHLRNIFDKLGVDRRAQLAAWVATNNLPTRPRSQAALS